MGVIDTRDLPEQTMVEGITMRVVTAETFTVAYVRLARNAVTPSHSHHHEQVTNVLEGELELTVGGEKHLLAPGQVMILPPNAPHSARTVTDCLVIDVFHPVRQDLRRG